MEKNLEIEYKLLLTEKIFKQLLNDLQSNHTYTQTNYYLTSPALSEKKYSLRLREKEGTYEMTLKIPEATGRMEHNLALSKEEFERIRQGDLYDNEITTLLKDHQIPLSQIKQAYHLTTIRHDIIRPYGLLSLDENTYLDQHDYEMEYEVTDVKKGYEDFLALLQLYGLTYTSNCPSKIKRVLDAL